MLQRPHDARKERADMLIALGMNVVFLAVVFLVCWPLGQIPLFLDWLQGYGVYWLALVASVVLLAGIERVFKIDPDDHYTLYVGLNLGVSVVLVVGWAAFAAVTLHDAVAGEPLWGAGILYVVGFLAGYLTFVVTTAFYSGTIYKIVTLPLVLISYLVFVMWPAGGAVLYGWFFALFGMGA